MNNNKQTEMASLSEICEEKRLVKSKASGKYLEKPVYFSSMSALIQGALSLVGLFENIHKKGYVFGGNATDHFRFSLKTGDLRDEAGKYLTKAYSVLPHRIMAESNDFSALQHKPDPVNNPDNESEAESITEIASDDPDLSEHNTVRLFMNEFMAPELVEAAASGDDFQFTMETDWYFLSVILFEYFFHTGSPFEGKMMVNRCFLSPLEKELYRVENGQFCMDIGEVKNTPVKGIQDKLIKYWNEYPIMLQRMFQKAFIEGSTLSNLRPTEVDWKQLLVNMAMDYQTCHCGFKGFSYRLKEKENGTLLCPKCKKVYYPLSNGMDRILLTEGGKLYECQTGRNPFDKDTVTGLVVENKQKKGLYGIKNISKGVWRGMYPDNSVKEIGNGQGIPIWNGMRLRFELGEDWSLKLIQPVELYDESEVEENEQ